jgi:uncharacterized protein YecT (DUF1311 family)
MSMIWVVRATVAVFLVVGATVPAYASAMVGLAQPPNGLEKRCEETGSGLEKLNCYLGAAAKSRTKVERAFERNMQSAIALDRNFNAYAKSNKIPGSSLAADLKTSQAAWLRYSKSQCSFEGGSSFGGSGTDILEAICHHRLNLLRLSELNAAEKLLDR